MRRLSVRWVLCSIVGVACLGIAGARAVRAPISAPTIDLRRVLQLEIADTSGARERGLSGRPSLPQDHGMLFVFGTSGIYPFWMREMRFPLDIVWINRGTVQEVARLNPPSHTSFAPEWHVPIFFADQVLEVNAGTADRLGLARGVRVILPE